MASFFFLVFPFRGEILGLTIAVIYIALICLLMDKWLLLFFFAVPATRGDSLYEKFQNKAYGYNVRDVGFYYSRLSFDNVIALQWAGRKILIFDNALKNSPYAEEILDDVLSSFKSGEVKRSTGVIFLFAVYNLPLVVLEKLFGRVKLYGLLSSLWLTPFKLMFESYELKKKKKAFVSHDINMGSELDTFTSLLARITGIYKTTGSDLMSMIFNRDGI